MSKATKFKYVAKEVLEEYPEPDESHPIMRVIGSFGNNLHRVESETGEEFLVQMPTKFRRNVWIKKGDYVIVEWIEDITKVQADITHILYNDQVRHLKQIDKWPPGFVETSNKSTTEKAIDDTEKPEGENDESDIDSSEDNVDTFVNRNRQRYMESASSGSESDDEAETTS